MPHRSAHHCQIRSTNFSCLLVRAMVCRVMPCKISLVPAGRINHFLLCKRSWMIPPRSHIHLDQSSGLHNHQPLVRHVCHPWANKLVDLMSRQAQRKSGAVCSVIAGGMSSAANFSPWVNANIFGVFHHGNETPDHPRPVTCRYKNPLVTTFFSINAIIS